MKKMRNILLVVTVASLSLLSFKTSKTSVIFVEAGNLTVVVNSNGAPSDINLLKLKGVLKGEQQRWKNGTKIKLALMKTSTDIGSDMTNRIFGMTVKELNKHYLAKVFQGKMSSPDFFTSETDLIKHVSQKPGAIGIVSTAKAKGTSTLNVDGKKSL
jgi:hypothetical protein